MARVVPSLLSSHVTHHHDHHLIVLMFKVIVYDYIIKNIYVRHEDFNAMPQDKEAVSMLLRTTLELYI